MTTSEGGRRSTGTQNGGMDGRESNDGIVKFGGEEIARDGLAPISFLPLVPPFHTSLPSFLFLSSLAFTASAHTLLACELMS